jgi:hypothetical protein
MSMECEQCGNEKSCVCLNCRQDPDADARIASLERERDELRKQVEEMQHKADAFDEAIAFDSVRSCFENNRQLRACLELLHSVQNGCPLAKYEVDWHNAMTEAEQLLGLSTPPAAQGAAT